MKTSIVTFTCTAALVLGAVLVCPLSPVHASDAPICTSNEPACFSSPAIFAGYEGLKNWFVAHVMTTFSYRERMIQMLAVGLFIGLFVMLRKMPGQT